MALTPTISACILSGCETIRITDTTGVYNATSNTGGYEDASTEVGSAITSATLDIYDADGDLIQSEDVTSQIPNTVAGTFDFTDIELDSYADGEMKIVYKLVGANGTYQYTLCKFFACSVRCCIDKMWVTVAGKICGECDCDENELIADALLAEGLYKAMLSSASCLNTTARDNMLARINKICNFKDCNC